MFWLIALIVLLVLVLGAAYLVGPDLARYMRIRRM